MILAGRRINDGMAGYVANDVIKTMLKRRQSIDQARVLVMGFTFKENVPDTRNTKVADLVRTLREFRRRSGDLRSDGRRRASQARIGVDLTNDMPQGPFDAIILAVRHEPIAKIGEAGIKARLALGGLIYDVRDGRCSPLTPVIARV